MTDNYHGNFSRCDAQVLGNSQPAGAETRISTSPRNNQLTAFELSKARSAGHRGNSVHIVCGGNRRRAGIIDNEERVAGRDYTKGRREQRCELEHVKAFAGRCKRMMMRGKEYVTKSEGM